MENQKKVNNEAPDLFEAQVEEIKADDRPLEQESMILHVSQEIDLDKKLADLEKSFTYLNKMREFCIARLNKNNVINWQDNPYLGESAMNQFMAVFGIGESNVKIEVVYENGTKKNITESDSLQGIIKAFFISGQLHSKTLGIQASFEGGASMEDMNNEKTKDNFFFWLKKAKANWRARGTKKLLGLDGLTWDDLSHVKKEDCKSVSFGTTTKADSEKANEVWNKLLEICNGNTKEAENLCSELTSFKGKDGNPVKGKTRPANLSEKALDILVPKVENLLNAEKKKKQSANDKECLSIMKAIGVLSEADKKAFVLTLEEFTITAEQLKAIRDVGKLKEFKETLEEKIEEKANQTSAPTKVN